MNFITKYSLYFHTLKYLKASQILGRVKFRMRYITPDERSAPNLRMLEGRWQHPASKHISMTGNNEFCFLNHNAHLNSPESWNAGNDLLWLYNLHYFDDLNATDARNRHLWHKDMMARWIAENPPGFGVGWNPYPISLRIVNWIKWHFSEHELSVEAVASLACQTRFLMQQVEWHIQGNHLLANAKALVFAGAFFEGEEADVWLCRGMDILGTQIPEQILDDGGHFERSPMYHAIVFEDMLDLLNLVEAMPTMFSNFQNVIAGWRVVLGKMRFWLDVMCHPDGRISFFNDAAFGITPPPSELFAYADRLRVNVASKIEGITHLEQSGYIRVNKGKAVLIIDVAPIGPDYLPGHAHADTLSFELSLNGKRVIVNSGTSQYGIGRQRDLERSTAAHNTVEIDGQNSSEVWAGFRVARRAYPKYLKISENDNHITIKASHNGYRWLPAAPVHERIWQISNQELSITDNVKGGFKIAIARFYFLPEVSLNKHKGTGIVGQGSSKFSFEVLSDELDIVPSKWYPQFGLAEPSKCLKLICFGNKRPVSTAPQLKFTLEYS